MTTQQAVYELMRLKTDPKPIKPHHGNCCTCQDCGYDHDECICIDLTSPDGTFWLMARLPEWDRFEEFCEWVLFNPLFHPITGHQEVIQFLLTWLGSDPSALFKALCEFLGLEVEE